MLERACSGLQPLKCQLGLLESTNGIDFKLVEELPVFGPEQLGYPQGTVEDPRVVKIDDAYYLTFAHRHYNYNCVPNGITEPNYSPVVGKMFEGINNTRSGIATSKDLRSWKFERWITGNDVDDRDVVIFPEKIDGKFVAIRRPMGWVGPEYGTTGPSIWISSSEDMVNWSTPELLARPRNTDWEGGKIGAASPPVRTDKGWLLLYHGVDDDVVYRVGIMMLDLEDPKKVIARCPHFIMEPEEYYEKVGLIIPNVIFPTAAVEKDGTLYIYYGCTDTCIGAATVDLNELTDHVLQYKIG